MKCLQLTLSNFGNFAYKVVNFTEGLNGIIGPNGSGKSHIMGGIRYAITGANPNTGNKVDNIYDRASPVDLSYVNLVFEHNGLRMVVQRNIRPSKPVATLTINDGEPIEGDTEVTTTIERILGTPCDVINEIVIVAQEDVFGFISLKPQQRAAQFQRLFNTEKAATLHSLIGEHLRGVEIPVVAVSRDQITTQITQAMTTNTELNAQLAKCRDYQTIEQFRDQHMALLNQIDQRNRLFVTLQSLQLQQTNMQTTQQQVRDDLAKKQLQRDAYVVAQQQQAAGAERATQQLATVQLLQQQHANYNRMQQRKIEAESHYQSLPARRPVAPEGYLSDLSLVDKTLQDMHTTIAGYRQFVASFSAGVSNCPTCGTSTDQLAPQLARAQAEIQRLEPLRDQLQDLRNKSAKHAALMMQYDAALAASQSSLTSIQTELQLVPVPEPIAGNPTELQAIRDQYAQLGTAIATVDREIQQLSTTAARLDGQADGIVQQINQTQSLLSGIPAHSDVVQQESRKAVEGLSQEADYHRNVEGNLTANTAKLAELQSQLKQHEEAEQKTVRARSWHSFMGRVRDLFHKDAAPRFVAQRNLQRLQSTINEILELFGSAFRVAADEGLSFKASFANGSIQPAERLSGGQKVILALAFRLALNLMFAENIGAIYLDEPTSWLDEQHIKGFEPVMQHLRSFASSRGMQSIIVTHERALAPLFDSVISL